MIVCKRKHLEDRCRERGYTIAEVEPCIVMTYADGSIAVDENHEKYPRKPKPRGGKPGTELAKLLALLGFKASAGCGCKKRAREMDERGTQWVRENESTVVGWLREEAGKRKLPFLPYAAKVIIRRACRNAERKGDDAD